MRLYASLEYFIRHHVFKDPQNTSKHPTITAHPVAAGPDHKWSTVKTRWFIQNYVHKMSTESTFSPGTEEHARKFEQLDAIQTNDRNLCQC